MLKIDVPDICSSSTHYGAMILTLDYGRRRKFAESGLAEAAHAGRRPWGMPSHYNRRLFTKDWDPMRTDTPVTVYRKDYQPYPYDIPEVSLGFDLVPESTEVRCVMQVRRKPGASADAALVLDGEELELVSVGVDGSPLPADRYHLAEHSLALYGLPETATVEIVSRCKPAANSTLMGLYVSGGNFFTQCEAEGFRRITWFADRPDVMSRYRVTLRATADYPVLLSNGNLLASRQLADGRNEVEWEDPSQALLPVRAGRGQAHAPRNHRAHRQRPRRVAAGLQRSRLGRQDRMGPDSLVRALRWDETRFGLELDLDRFMVVAVHDFNMGAMENKGLNIFNAAYVLADAQTATDANYEGIESVIGHEYFHNWTGNRVTCRDWFQLSLKEGLTVFRDQEFSADMMAQGMDEAAAASARAVKRIDDVAAARRPVPRRRRSHGPPDPPGKLPGDRQLLHRHRVRKGRRGHPHAAHAAGRGGLSRRHG